MKLLLTITLCLCTLSSYTQINNSKDASGNYSFSRAAVSACNSDTKAEIFSYAFPDIASLDGVKLNELPVPDMPIFLSAEIRWNAQFEYNYLSMCSMWNNGKDYEVAEDGELTPMESKMANDEEAVKEDPFPLPYSIRRAEYDMDIQGNTATFTFRVPYGNSMYDFPLEAKLVVVMVKDSTL